MQAEPRVHLEILSAWIVRVEVRQSSGDFGLRREDPLPARPGTEAYLLGHREAPLYRLGVRHGPGEAWSVTPLRTGRGLEGLEVFDPEVPQDYLDWFVESGSLQGLETPWQLPVGRYFLVQTSRPLHTVRWMTMGASQVIVPPNFWQLRSQKTFYSVVFGAEQDRPPDTGQPLVGLVLPEYLREHGMHGLFFFSFSRAPRPSPPREAGSGYVLVVPIEGPLVLGLDYPATEARSAGACEPWTEALARRFADWCARLTEEWREP